jgi:SAM-dependent methyltransferase
VNFYKRLRKDPGLTTSEKVARIDTRLSSLGEQFEQAFGRTRPAWQDLLSWIERIEFEIEPTPRAQYSFAKRLWRFARTIPLIDGTGRMLDLGCGLGTDAILLHLSTGVHITGIDMDDLSLETCRVRLRHYRRWLKFSDGAIEDPRKMNATNLAFAEHYFDYAWSNESIEHIHPPDQLFRELGRVVRPHGIVFVLNQNGTSIYEQLKAIWTRGFHVYYPDVDPLNGERILIAEERLLTPGTCRRLLGRAGFKSTRVHLNGVVPSPLARLSPSGGALAAFDSLICRVPLLRSQASDFVIIGRKDG